MALMRSGAIKVSGAIQIHIILCRCRELELAAAKLYTMLSQLHASIPEMSQIWRKTAIEEHNHAAQFTFALDNLMGTPQAVEVDPLFLERCFTAIDLLCEEVRSNPPKPEEALRATIAVEKAMEDLHMNCISVFQVGAIKKLYDGMMAADRCHVGTLEQYLEKITRKGNAKACKPPSPLRPRARRGA